jgi:hypothetical protein
MAPMTEHERQIVTSLCARIADERNPAVFTQLVMELDTLLGRLNSPQATSTGFEGDMAT